MSFANKLKGLMEELDLTQAKVSDLTGIGRSSISQYVSGKMSRLRNAGERLPVRWAYRITTLKSMTRLQLFNTIQPSIFLLNLWQSL